MDHTESIASNSSSVVTCMFLVAITYQQPLFTEALPSNGSTCHYLKVDHIYFHDLPILPFSVVMPFGNRGSFFLDYAANCLVSGAEKKDNLLMSPLSVHVQTSTVNRSACQQTTNKIDLHHSRC
jgi:hypothetical protein